MYQIKEVSDIFADACVRDDTGNLLFASLYGRDGALLQLFSAFSLKRDQGGLDGFTLVNPEGEEHRVNVANVDRLDKLSGRLPKANLFGNLAHTWLYDERLLKRDYVNRIAWVIDEVSDFETKNIDQQILDQAWLVMKDLSPIPLLDDWQDKVMGMTAFTAITQLSKTLYPPLGRVTGFRVSLDEDFVETISIAVRSKVLLANAPVALNVISHTNDSAVCSAIADHHPLVENEQPIRFPLGQIVMTPGVQDVLEMQPHLAYVLLRRHSSGDWGCVCENDRLENNRALKNGFRILSAYAIDASQECKGFGENTIWIITERDRSVTTLLLPNEY